MDDDGFGAVVAYELAALFRYGVRHDNAGLIAFDRAHQCNADALVAARRLHNDAVRIDFAALFGLFDHLPGSARFHGAANVHALELHEDLRRIRFGQAIQANKGRAPHGFEDVVVNHLPGPFSMHRPSAERTAARVTIARTKEQGLQPLLRAAYCKPTAYRRAMQRALRAQRAKGVLPRYFSPKSLENRLGVLPLRAFRPRAKSRSRSYGPPRRRKPCPE